MMRCERLSAPTAAIAALLISACAGANAADTTNSNSTDATIDTSRPAATTTSPKIEHGGDVDADLLWPAYLGAAAFQDVDVAEAAGWSSTIDTLGCFENPEAGGMGVHWLNETLLDAELDAAQPEALVYELDAAGDVVGLVGHEYLVPFEAWTTEDPPNLFGIDFHKHPVLPFWILHAYIWKDNPNGVFADWNPAIRMCPDGSGVFGVDLPAPTPDDSDDNGPVPDSVESPTPADSRRR